MLEVAFYSDAMTTARRYGLARYAWELFGALLKLDSRFHVRPVSARIKVTAAEVRSMQAEFGYVPLPWGHKVTAALWSTLGAPGIERWTPWAEIVHSVEPDHRVATNRPLVVTVHDIGPLTHPEHFRASYPWLLRASLKDAMQRAAAIICVSEATANAVREYTKCDPGDRLVVVPEGVSEEFFASSPVEMAPPSFEKTTPYFLWTGSFSPRKNLDRVIAAFEQIAADIPHALVLCGGSGWDSEPSFRRITASPFAHRIRQPGRVSDAELRALYRGATGFVFVSLMEGFGLPILEAMASGCPVITSNCSSMPEVAGDAALLVDPLEIDDIAQAMRRLATDASYQAELTSRGRVWASKFRWATCAAAVANVYEKVAPSRIRARGTAAASCSSVPTIGAKELSGAA